MSFYPYLFRFLRMAYFETDPEVSCELAQLKGQHIDDSTGMMLSRIDRLRFKDPQAPELLLELITLAAEGYMPFNSQSVFNNPEASREKMLRYINSLRGNYYR